MVILVLESFVWQTLAGLPAAGGLSPAEREHFHKQSLVLLLNLED